MVMASWFRIIVLLLTVALLWRLMGWCSWGRNGRGSATVWTFLGRVVFVLGGLMVTAMLLMGLAMVPRHISLEKKQTAGAVRSTVSPKTHSHPDVPVSIDKLWDRINRPRIPIPIKQVELVSAMETEEETEEVKAANDNSAAVTKDPTEPVNPVAQAETADGVSRERPDWVVHPPKRVGNTYQRVVVSGPFKTVDECHVELEEKLRQAVFQRMAADMVDGPVYPDFTLTTYKDLGIRTDYIYREICTAEYVESLEHSFGPMVQVHLKLEFDPSIEQHLRNVWRQYQARQRLQAVALLALAGLLLLGLTYGLLKLDTRTRGSYSKRLLLGVPAVIMGLFLLLMALLRVES